MARAAPVEVGERRGLRQLGHAELFGHGLDAVELLERLCGRGCVVVADLFDADDGDPPAAQRTQLAPGDR